MFCFSRRLIIFLLLSVLSSAGWSAPKVAVSIAPLHGLVTDLMSGVAEPVLLYEGSQSPHSAALTPQQLKALMEADLLIWVGPELEVSLARLIERRPASAQNLQWHDYDAGMTLHENRESLFNAAGSSHEHEHDHGDLDPHFWLSVSNAQQFVESLATELAALDPDHAERYADNAESLVNELDQLDKQLRQRLSAVADRPFVVFHDGFQYFEREYGLNALGALVLRPDVPPGPRTVARLVEVAKPHDGICLFHEPQFSDRWMQTLARSVPQGHIAEIDPLGFEQTAGAGHYPRMMTTLADDLGRCLEQLP